MAKIIKPLQRLICMFVTFSFWKAIEVFSSLPFSFCCVCFEPIHFFCCLRSAPWCFLPITAWWVTAMPLREFYSSRLRFEGMLVSATQLAFWEQETPGRLTFTELLLTLRRALQTSASRFGMPVLYQFDLKNVFLWILELQHIHVHMHVHASTLMSLCFNCREQKPESISDYCLKYMNLFLHVRKLNNYKKKNTINHPCFQLVYYLHKLPKL